MKNLIGITAVTIAMAVSVVLTFCVVRAVVDRVPTAEQSSEVTMGDLLDAIEWVESKGDSNAIGDGGDAVGAYQIHKIFVRDCNRILGREVHTYTDRLNKIKSREMAKIYLKYYGGTTEEMVRKFNGGPQGHKKQATLKYWLKIKSRLESK